jgi:hypothetical protein
MNDGSSWYPLPGGCHCGAVRYDLLAPAISVQHCHCSRCRKATGTFMASGAVVRKADLRIRGAENLTRYRSTASFEGQFCRICGSGLFYQEDSEPELMYFSPGSLDGGAHPGHPSGRECHIYTGSKAPWETIGGPLPQYDTVSPDEIITAVQRQRGEA